MQPHKDNLPPHRRSLQVSIVTPKGRVNRFQIFKHGNGRIYVLAARHWDLSDRDALEMAAWLAATAGVTSEQLLEIFDDVSRAREQQLKPRIRVKAGSRPTDINPNKTE